MEEVGGQGAGKVQARCGQGAGEVQARCRRGAGKVQARCGQGAGEVRARHFLSFSSFSSFFLSRSRGFFDFLRSFHTCTHTQNPISTVLEWLSTPSQYQPIPEPSCGIDPLRM